MSTSVLIVEDEGIVALDLQSQLEQIGYTVIGIAASTREALDIVRVQRPSVALMDIVIQGPTDGIETAEILRRGFGIPVVFLSSFSDEVTLRRAAEVAPYGYLTKPYQIREVRAALEIALTKSRMERQLSESERWFASTLNCVGDGVVVIDHDAIIRFMNPVAEELTGLNFERAAGRRVEEVICLLASAEDSAELAGLTALRENRVISTVHSRRIRSARGNEAVVDESAAPVTDRFGKHMGAVVILRDASVRMQHEKRLIASEQRFRSAFDFAPVGMALISLAGRFLQVNDACCRFLGYSPEDLLAIGHEKVTFGPDFEFEKLQLLDLVTGEQPAVQFEKRYQHRDGHQIWALVSITLLSEERRPLCYLYQIHDLTDRKEAEHRLVNLAYYDPLTGLANRTRLREELDHMLAVARRNGHKLAVVFMDLDRFKQINDTLGHEAGDQLLKEVAVRLNRMLRETDCVGRLGGDEFILGISDIEGTASILSVAEKLRSTISEPVELAGRMVVVTPSLGVSVYPDDGTNSQELLRNADSALYVAKAEGRNRVGFFQPEMSRQAALRLETEGALRGAIERHELFLDYQPIIQLDTGEIRSFEALLRWRRPEGLLSPATFIPVAEETGLILPIGAWVLHEACRFAASWARPIAINVNCSAKQLREDSFIDTVKAVLEVTGLAPERLHLELTESILLKDDRAQIDRMERLKALGIHLSIDDYGTGYSPLSYLKLYSPHSLKIDALFISDLESNANSAAIVSATIAMARSLGIKVVAEGVETREQALRLHEYGCETIQGYLCQRPTTPAAVEALITRGSLPVLP